MVITIIGIDAFDLSSQEWTGGHMLSPLGVKASLVIHNVEMELEFGEV